MKEFSLENLGYLFINVALKSISIKNSVNSVIKQLNSKSYIIS